MKVFYRLLFLFFCLAGYPASGQSYRPWTWWFWPGSAVTESGIRDQLKSFHQSGFGGVSINAIYTAKDPRHAAILFMSDEWIRKVNFTLKTADSLGMQADLSLVSGWPFGGPTVSPADAAKKISGTLVGSVPGFVPIERKICSADTAILLSLTAVQPDRKPIQLLSQTDGTGTLRTRLPSGEWKLYALYLKPTGQKVKRAGPGGEGRVMDHFSQPAVDHYLSGFDDALQSFSRSKLRAVFNDSYEVYGADGTPEILNEFRLRRGYSLEDHPEIFLGPPDHPDRMQILADYRQTISELLTGKFLATWNERSHAIGLKTREQAHGAPANILDLYAAADIPESESFGSSALDIPGVRIDPDFNPSTFGRPDPLVLKFASSAAHMSGKRLVSAETATWLANHFKVSLSQVKPQVDELFASGINQIMLASSSYSPSDAPWPGWIFYASTDFGSSTTFYDYLPDFSEYIRNCQKILQESTADTDLLLYFPFAEIISTVVRDMGNLVTFDVHHPEKWLYPFDYGKLARELLDRGISFDFISDNQIRALTPVSGQTILIPDCRVIPVETALALDQMAANGSHIIFHNRQPADVPGFYRIEERRKELAAINKRLQTYYKQVFVQSDIHTALKDAGIKFEPFGCQGLRYIRKVMAAETIYFITNLGNSFREGWLKPSVGGRNITLFDPLTRKSGALQQDAEGRIFLQLVPGQSCFIRINDSGQEDSDSQRILTHTPISGFSIPGPWQLTFSGGGPAIPSMVKSTVLGSWTTLPDTLCRWFSGTGTYETDFVLPGGPGNSSWYRLNLGDVREAAEIWINDHPVGRVWCVPFCIDIDPSFLKEGSNHLRIAVTNLSANRIIWQDRNHIPWKNYFFVDITYEDFDASHWEPVESGLLGSVILETGN